MSRDALTAVPDWCPARYGHINGRRPSDGRRGQNLRARRDKLPGGFHKHPKGQPRPKDQENFTDPDSRIMVDGSGALQQSYNAQIAVDASEQIIVAALVTNAAPDTRHLMPVIDQAEQIAGKSPCKVLADTGYRSEENFTRLRERNIDGYISLGREAKSAKKIQRRETKAMQRRFGTKRGRATYKKRKHTRPNRASAARGPAVEPAFGWIKAVHGFRQFSLRGIDKVNAEWHLICSATNLRRMASRLCWA